MPNKINGLVCNCQKCLQTFFVNDNVHKIQTAINSEQITLTVLICPFCKKEHIVQIDNEETLQILEKQMKINTEAAIKNFYQETYTGLEERKKIAALLVEKRNLLNIKYNGSFYYFENKKKKIKLTEPTVKISELEE